MATKRRSLGKGLDALLAGSSRPEETRAVETSSNEKGLLRELPVDLIQRGQYQPRRDFDPFALQELADSIKAQGVMQPIVVRPIANERFEIIAGERRWRAVQQAGLDSIPALIRNVSDEATVAMSLIENIQREDLNPIEEAYALERLQDEFEMTQQQVADAVGKSRSAVANLLRLTSLPHDVRTLLEHGDLDMGHARCLLTLEAEQQVQLARRVVAKGLSVRQAEALVRQLQSDKPKPKAKTMDPNIRSLQDELSQKLGSAVHIQHSSSGKGKLILNYGSLDELDGILSHLK
ncbi:ParB/RepB/Spo0J family partition protein [Congregibacter variabilis]|uniref:Probable chromosome-partitioning protein ParB n=1 Tax=Congregibacter variabilis TaxID=3081200 RepID=A0ABZ0I1P2_9GAMM|nr:ParB/RepB/Spo0J family partition protein [Congregibacter sp. IMCC43200]